ncbi:MULTISPECIES: hypothetical protein [Mycobacteriaceae]|uniref:Uncharacterized protein n=1 Tax=Mycolicibacterium parafortuitum TaxID=39692 RepID=A0ACC6MI06_MYCPF|nr:MULTISPECIES: hypothetical protein [Mycobacteriaceae]MDZ5086547.1 hypothetical protein [Mycolicibacterium parafortuitum]GFM20412.1 uncharacterized protein PO1_contig-075-42 [Mycobacterium sp. PO1]GFM24561.1 uncharacterized protein PO2_contig-041-42 [Mycobacterium sp. PO2]
MDDRTENLMADLRRASLRTPVQRAHDAEIRAKIDALIASGEISEDELNRGVLRARLKVYGHATEVPGHGLLARLPGWTDGLFTDSEVTTFVFMNGTVGRECYDRLASDVGIVHCSKLLCDLNDSGQLDLADPTMNGIVAAAWASGEPGSESCIGYREWQKLFRLNGFTYLGAPSSRPTEPVSVYRGCTPEHRFGMSWSIEMAVARSFATEGMSSRPPGVVYVAHVHPEHLLAFIEEGHDEHEWVVDPAGLSDANVRLLDPPGPQVEEGGASAQL